MYEGKNYNYSLTSCDVHFNAPHTLAGAVHRSQRSADTQSGGDSVNTTSFPYIEVLRGRDGRDG